MAYAAAGTNNESSALPEMRIVATPVHPALVEQVLPEYPYDLRRAGAEGRVSLDMIVDRKGRVKTVTVLDSDNHALSDAALAAVRQWRFVPASDQLKADHRHATITFHFVLEPAGGISAGIQWDGAS